MVAAPNGAFRPREDGAGQPGEEPGDCSATPAAKAAATADRRGGQRRGQRHQRHGGRPQQRDRGDERGRRPCWRAGNRWRTAAAAARSPGPQNSLRGQRHGHTGGHPARHGGREPGHDRPAQPRRCRGWPGRTAGIRSWWPSPGSSQQKPDDGEAQEAQSPPGPAAGQGARAIAPISGGPQDTGIRADHQDKQPQPRQAERPPRTPGEPQAAGGQQQGAQDEAAVGAADGGQVRHADGLHGGIQLCIQGAGVAGDHARQQSPGVTVEVPGGSGEAAAEFRRDRVCQGPGAPERQRGGACREDGRFGLALFGRLELAGGAEPLAGRGMFPAGTAQDQQLGLRVHAVRVEVHFDQGRRHCPPVRESGTPRRPEPPGRTRYLHFHGDGSVRSGGSGHGTFVPPGGVDGGVAACRRGEEQGHGHGRGETSLCRPLPPDAPLPAGPADRPSRLCRHCRRTMPGAGAAPRRRQEGQAEGRQRRRLQVVSRGGRGPHQHCRGDQAHIRPAEPFLPDRGGAVQECERRKPVTEPPPAALQMGGMRRPRRGCPSAPGVGVRALPGVRLTAASTYRCQRLYRSIAVPALRPGPGAAGPRAAWARPRPRHPAPRPAGSCRAGPATPQSAAPAPGPPAEGFPIRSTPAVFRLIFPAAGAGSVCPPSGCPGARTRATRGSEPAGTVSPCRGTRTFCPSSRTAARLSWSGSAPGALPPAAAMASCRRLPCGNSTMPARTTAPATCTMIFPRLSPADSPGGSSVAGPGSVSGSGAGPSPDSAAVTEPSGLTSLVLFAACHQNQPRNTADTRHSSAAARRPVRHLIRLCAGESSGPGSHCSRRGNHRRPASRPVPDPMAADSLRLARPDRRCPERRCPDRCCADRHGPARHCPDRNWAELPDGGAGVLPIVRSMKHAGSGYRGLCGYSDAGACRIRWWGARNIVSARHPGVPAGWAPQLVGLPSETVLV